MTKTEEKKQDKAVKLRLLRTAVIDGVRRQRGWAGVTAQPLPQNCFIALKSTTQTTKGEK